MNTFKKNQIIITALAIMIAIAGYLNFTDKAKITEDKYVFNNKITDISDNTGLVPNEDILLNANVLEELSEEELAKMEELEVMEPGDSENSVVGEAIFVNSASVESNYFLESKIKREQTRGLSSELLLSVINNDKLDKEQKTGAAADMVKLQDRIEKEAAAESMLEAKGFKEVFVRMDENGVDVVVNTKNLSENDLAQIADVVSRKTGVSADKVVIVPLKIGK